MNINAIIAQELHAQESQIQAAITLLDEGATVPFIARYRKEITGGLDDTQLRQLTERLQYLRELQERKIVVRNTIAEQGKLTETLAQQIEECQHKTALEDLYLPYRPKRRTKAQIAHENGLTPLAEQLFRQPEDDPERIAADFLNENIPDTKTALDGARAILMEQFAEDATLIGKLREKLWCEAELHAQIIDGKQTEGEKFRDYFDHREPIAKIPSHRALAILRARNEGILQAALKYRPDDAPITEPTEYEHMIANHFGIRDHHRPADKWLHDTIRLAWRAKIFLSLELEAFTKLKEYADTHAITVFAKNLKDLLLAAPAGRLPTLGLDPGFRTGIKVAAVNDTGKLLATDVVYLHHESQAITKLSQIIQQYHIKLIAIGNGTASRETDKLVSALMKTLPENSVHKIIVSEAGASVYSASKLGAMEFPDLDVSLRGAVSIARRLQDPLAELVKIDPKSIGVGQYQHDVNQIQLAKSLDNVVEDCVNAVGVDVNTASAPLLARISGLNQTLAKNIIAHRDAHGAFANRKALLQVPRLGHKTFEQAAGFLRIIGGTEPLDASAVHPEAYPLVAKMLKKQNITANELIGKSAIIAKIKANDFIDERFGLPTILDILAELEKPNRDPRGTFQMAQFAEGINEINDLQVGMILEGVVSNVADFGAFVDIGVHQDGLVHISAMAEKFVANPRDIVKTGDVVRVKIVEVDAARKRIALSMRLNDSADSGEKRNFRQPEGTRAPTKSRSSVNPNLSVMANAFAKLKK